MKFNKQKHLLAKREAANAFRVLRTSEELIDFCSNDYLGLAKMPRKSAVDGPYGSGGSRLLAGNYKEVEELEQFLADFHQSESALFFNSGYNANVGFFSAVPQKGDTVLYDELIHASIKDGMRLSFAKSFSFKHNNLEDLKNRLSRAEGDVYVVVEAVYSMDGDSAPLKELTDLSEKLGFCLVVDEAHSVGVFGNKGEGLVQELGLEKKIPVRIVTFGKAIGAHGAAVLSPKVISDFLVNFARSFIYTTALPKHCIETVKEAYLEMEKGGRTSELKSIIKFFKTEISGVDLIESNSSIQCVLVLGNEFVKGVSGVLHESGLDVRPVMSPTVREGEERLRICLHTFNTKEQITLLCKSLKSALDVQGN